MRTQESTTKSPGYKGVRAGSRKEKVRRAYDKKGRDAAFSLGRKLNLEESSLRRWDSDWRKDKAPTYISIRDLQKISGDTIRDLRGPTPIKSGDRTVGILVPLKAADPDRLAAVLARAESLAKGRDVERDDEALKEFSDVDPVDWSVEEVRKLMAETRKR
jgi:hypothetical protein